MRRNFPTIASCTIVASFLAFCLWQSTGEVILSVFVAVLGALLGLALFWQSESSWAASWGDLEKTGYHKEDPRHPHNPAYVSEAEIQEGLEELKAKQGIQITPRGDVMLHSNPECYTSPFSLN